MEDGDRGIMTVEAACGQCEIVCPYEWQNAHDNVVGRRKGVKAGFKLIPTSAEADEGDGGIVPLCLCSGPLPLPPPPRPAAAPAIVSG